VKYIVDYLSEEELAISFQLLEGARIYAEPVFREAENYIEEFAGELSKKFQTDKKLILASTGEEAVSYLSGSKPDEEILKGRLTSIALFASWSDRSQFLGPLADSLGAALESTDNDQLGGQTAYKGKVIGKVKVIFDPVAEAHKVEEGDILVTGMTRPEYLPIMKKASAFITDAGGMLCHAAITARELKKPCIIGTKIATKILKDGDVVEVDAERGIVRKI
jgi:phosphohistidine swiveling domain-containing protein